MTPWWQAACRHPDPAAEAAARARQDQLTKPRGALGELEAVAIRLAGLQGRVLPALDHLAIALFAGDHGVVEEGVSAFPQAVTGQMLANFVQGGAAISVLARHLGARLEVIDLGLAVPVELDGVRRLALGPGTANFTRQPAMSAAQCDAALAAGRDALLRAAAEGCQLFVGGEMGIGNTTAATALACALLGEPATALSGRGTGLDDAGVRRKADAVARALALHGEACTTPLETLRRLGGFEVAALAGAYLAGAQQGVPALVDGFICTAAALVAVRLNPGCRPWLLFGHRSAEAGHARLLAALDARPLLGLGLRLGEGSGAALAVPLLRQACALHAQMATFTEAEVSDRPA